MIKQSQRLIILACGHGLNDFVAGYMLGNLLYYGAGLTFLSAGFLIYNLLAFGGQYFVALGLQKFHNNKLFLSVACSFNIIAVYVFSFQPLVALVLAGMASAIYHVSGASACIIPEKAGTIGMFAAPGIIGLTLAGYCSYLHLDLWTWLI